jgi:undecaprenyl-diphosphatase
MQKNTRYMLITGFLAILGLVMSIFAWFTKLFPSDLYLTLRLQSLHSNFLLSIMKGVSFIFGGWFSIAVVVVIGILVWWRIGKLEAILIPVAGLLSLVNTVLKLIIGRQRPPANLVQVFYPMQTSGFPSGHAMFSIMVLGLLAYFIFINMKNRILRTVVLAGLIALILLIGISRVYLGVHWPSDVVGGYVIGGALLTALIWFYRTKKVHREAQLHLIQPAVHL